MCGRVAEPSSVAAVCDRRFSIVLLALVVSAFSAPTAKQTARIAMLKARVK